MNHMLFAVGYYYNTQIIPISNNSTTTIDDQSVSLIHRDIADYLIMAR
jgi:hypothetical protein